MKTFLTVENKRKITKKLEEYILEVLQDEEYLNTFEKCREDAKRVECFRGENLTVEHIEDWLRGLPLGVCYMTYNICIMLCSFVNVSEDDFYKEHLYKENPVDLDNYYWKQLAKIIFALHDSNIN